MSTDAKVGKEEWSDLLVDKNGETGFTKLYRWLTTIEDRTSMSLPAFLKRAVIESRVYLTREAAREECVNDLLYCINVMYAGWCMTALSMNQMVQGSKIRDILNTVATESIRPQDAYKSLDQAFAALENYKSVNSPFFPVTLAGPSNVIPSIDDPDEDASFAGGAGNKVIEFPKDYRLVSGIVIDVSFGLGDARDKKVLSVPVAVRLDPLLINQDAAKQFFAANFRQDMWMRWFKVKTGEISFWKDFLFEMDLLDEKYKAIRHDRTGTVKDMYDAQQSALSSYLLKIIGWRADRQNIASSIHIFTKPQFQEFCRTTHCNFDRRDDLLKYLRKTLSMMIAVIDNEYQMVDMYIAGVGKKTTYQFSQLQNYTKPNQYDLTSVMRAFANTNAPRF